MGKHLIHAVASRNAVRALDAAHRPSTNGYEPCFDFRIQRPMGQLEPPV